MAILTNGETTEMKGSGKTPYTLRNIDGTYDCSCVAWKMQSHAIDVRTCKHLVKHLGVDFELNRVGFDALPTAVKKKLNKSKPGNYPKKTAKKTLKETPNEQAEPKRVPPLLLAHKWDNEQDVTGWHLSEKLDGVRAYWGTSTMRPNGSQKDSLRSH